MNYRRLGHSGLKVSELSFGSWVTFGNQVDEKLGRECLAAAKGGGVNFFDNAEVYAAGESETIMGAAIKALRWPRLDYVISTKFFWGITEGPNAKNTLNRKYLRQAIEGSLKRLQLDYVDLVYCHRPDPETPLEETVWAMHDMIERGQALYWGTSEWPAQSIQAAHDFARRTNLHAPLMEQPQYNLFHRARVEQEYAPLYNSMGLGLTVWSPLASGLLSGKYANGIPKDSRATVKGYGWLRDLVTDKAKLEAVKELEPIAAELHCTTAQLALAWCLTNPHVSSVITGASRPKQIVENLKAVEIAEKINDEIKARIEAITVSLSD